jgi:hypothetical protein
MLKRSRAEVRVNTGVDRGTVSRLAGRLLTVRRQRTSPLQFAALVRINAPRRKQRGDVD